MAGRRSPQTPPSASVVLAALRPDRVGQDRRRAGDRRPDSRRARLGRLDAGLPRPAGAHEPGRGRTPRRDLAARPAGHRRRVPAPRARGDRRDRRRRADGDRRRRLGPLVPGGADRRRPAGGRAGGCPRPLGAALRPARRGDRPCAARAARPARRRASARERPQAGRPRARALAGGRHARAGAAAALDRGDEAADVRRRSRRAAGDARGAHPRPRDGDVRPRRGGRGARRRRGRPAGARARGGADAPSRRRRSRSSSARRCASPRTSGSGCAGSRASS